MSQGPSRDRLPIPERLSRQLDAYRRRVWTVKLLEAGCGSGLGIVACFLAMFTLDRVWETPAWPRASLLGLALAALAIVPFSIHRWVWRRRKPEQLARLLARTYPRVGDQLLGVLELAHDDSEQARSRRLVEAAIEQVAADASRHDFGAAVSGSRTRLWAGALATPLVIMVGLFVAVPAAAFNSLSRLVTPWNQTPRYTFAILDRLPGWIVVAHGEPFPLQVNLDRATAWHPVQGEVRSGTRPPVVARLNNGGYAFEMPAIRDVERAEVRIGDARRFVEVEPMFRPELTSVVADMTLPGYLGRPGPIRKDLRGGSISVVEGSLLTITAAAGRDLASSEVDGVAQALSGPRFSSQPLRSEGSREILIRWTDRFGLAGKEPLTLKVTGLEDEAPSLTVEDLPRQKVVIDTELITFKVHAYDDFGVRQVGLIWRGLDPKAVASPASGERVLAPGGPDRESMEVVGVFSGRSDSIEPQPIELRAFVEDYRPGRPRVLSPPYTLYLLNPKDHAVWLTEQLSRWQGQSLEVRDREMQLHEENKRLRDRADSEFDRPETRKSIEAQASAERANGRRLAGLVTSGEDLVKQAMRNPEFGVGHLERWAATLQVLKDISSRRMPSVADLLKQAAQAPRVAGIDRSAPGGRATDPPPGPVPPTASVPSVVDRESSQQATDPKPQPPGPGSQPTPPRLSLPQTEIAGGVKPAPPGPPPAARKVEEAVSRQKDLLAEFDKVATELNRVLANLEGSTLVKRLKAASRVQTTIASKLVGEVANAFGLTRPNSAPPSIAEFEALSDQETKASQTVSTITDDLAAYSERRRIPRYKAVLDEMTRKDATGSLRLLAADLSKEPGLSIAQAEFWSDTFDRWADDLVEQATSGEGTDSPPKGSLPPSVVLELLQVLEGEVNLREETGVAQQARPALTLDDHDKLGRQLSKTQSGLRDRVDQVNRRIKALPESLKNFGDELTLLGRVAGVMDEAAGILDRPETGPPAIAAETEVIELLLQSKRVNPKPGGGGGGSSPGGGGQGTTQTSALALIGQGRNQNEIREDRPTEQSGGETGLVLPEEFRSGLDQYFQKLDRKPSGR